MKKTTIFAYACLVALVSAGMSSCKNDEPNGHQKITEEVKTEFSIALPNQLAKRYMPGTTVQKNGLSDFQGITGIFLVPFAEQTAITASDSRLGKNIILSGDVESTDADKPSAAKVYSDVSIPLSTGSFLFYGKSAKTGTKFEVGSLLIDTASTYATPASFTFDLEPIVASASALTSNSSNGGKLLQYLTSVAIASDGTKAWYAYTDLDNAAMKAMFDTYTSMHGLSSFEVERVLSDLYKSLMPLTSDLAVAIKDSIDNDTYATVDGSGNVSLIAALDNFPAEHNLPEGSIDMVWNAGTHKFTAGAYSNMAMPDRYVYPAQLWYYANSTIKTSNTSKQTMYDNVNDWAAILAAHTDAASVNTRTRAVAIEDPVQYAVARLDVQVRLKDAVLDDNSATVEGSATEVDCSAGLPVSAILIGGQKQVGFDFAPTAGDHPEYTIYDNVMASAAEETPAAMLAEAGLTYSAMNHTLVLENGTNDVMVAVELTNTTGVDFYGAGGQLIPANGKFYVVGKLIAENATETGGHVFKQDFTTTAKLTLKDLKSAYNTIPDLRTPQLELGFSIDLTWQSGHTYEVDFN